MTDADVKLHNKWHGGNLRSWKLPFPYLVLIVTGCITKQADAVTVSFTALISVDPNDQHIPQKMEPDLFIATGIALKSIWMMCLSVFLTLW